MCLSLSVGAKPNRRGNKSGERFRRGGVEATGGHKKGILGAKNVLFLFLGSGYTGVFVL